MNLSAPIVARCTSSCTRIGQEFGQGLLQLVYPAVCASCGQSIPTRHGFFCEPCRSALIADSQATCPRCAATVGPFAHLDNGCTTCRLFPFRFERVLRLGTYDGLLRDLILRMKHAPGELLAELLGDLWGEHSGPRLRELAANVVIPVPLHWSRRWARGYNQSEALAHSLAVHLRLPCRSSWLRRVRRTPHQTSQAYSARLQNVRQAFHCLPWARIRGKAVLLVDDVLTTGSTCSEAARALLAAGATRVTVAVLARS